MRTRTWALIWTIARAAMAIAILAAIVAQLFKTVGTAIDLHRNVTTTIGNFFSFFTILTNAATAIILLSAVIWFVTRGPRADAEPLTIAVALACVSTYMIITGIVYNALLRGIALTPDALPVPWSNEVLHLVGPLFLLADVFVGPRRRALPWRTLWLIVAFPILWAIYTMIRGGITTDPVSHGPYWYPYPFLNPHLDGGWPSVILYIVGIAAAMVVVGAFVVSWGRRVGVAGTAPQPPAPEPVERSHAPRP
jgi:hypothetical protein